MSASSRPVLFTLCVSALLSMVCSPGFAQFVWPRSVDGSCIRAEYLVPSFAQQNPYYEISGYTLALSGRLQFGEATFFVIEIPFTSTSTELKYNPFGGGTTSRSKSSIGNIYLGLELVEKDSPLSWDFGIRVPTISEDNMEAAIMGIWGDVNRWEIYIAKMIALQGAASYHSVFESGVALFFRAGPSVWIPTEKGDAIVFLDYGAGLGFENDMFRVGAGISGRSIVTEEKLFYNKKSLYHIEFGANIRFAQFRPGLFYRIPLDKEVKDVISHTIGISLTYVL